MDKTKIYSQEDAIKSKKGSIYRLNRLYESYIQSGDPQLFKKVVLISKWIIQFSNYIDFEDNFDPKRNVSYQRGDIVFVNLGFNIGSELGGPHYAIVLDKDNKKNSSSVTILPMTSYNAKKRVYERDIYIGNELYQKVYKRNNTLKKKVSEQLSYIEGLSDIIESAIDSYKKTNPEDLKTDEEIILHRKTPHEIETLKEVLERNKKAYSDDLRLLEKEENEISLMKEGSIARIEQITTVSKMRINNPQKAKDTLFNIKLSSESMKKINNKIKELYIF